MPAKTRLFALLICTALLLSGCVPGQGGEAPDEIAMPEPSAEPMNMFMGERLPSRLTNIALYYPMSDGAAFSTVTRGIRADAGETMIEAAVNALLGPSEGDGMYISSGETRLVSCEYGCGIATINLSIDARSAQGEQELLSLIAAIGNTLLGIEGVRGVNVLIGGQSESFGQLPAGVQTEVIPSVTAAYAQLLAEHDHLVSGGDVPVARSAVLYFPTADGRWLVPELRSITPENGSFTLALLDALRDGPLDEDCAAASIPAGAELLECAPQPETLSDGEHVLTLNFAPTLPNYLALSGLDMWELMGSAALTVCSFLPEIDALRIQVDGETVTSCEMGNGTLTFEDGLVRRSDFAGRIGSVATLYLAAPDGTLQTERHPVSMRSALSPRSLLAELFQYSIVDAGALRFPAPEAVSASDVLGIQVSGQIARINLSGNFYRCCQQLSGDAERQLVYCIVNTLCEMDDVNAVRFYVEGIAAQTLAGGVYLRRPLMPSPGMVIAQPDIEGEP